ncbi:hypothetical protein [Streptomyces sp. NPDC088789]|uniref:hypothetical protein n=1 Tax=Streptomyces sp. NPDC088789 TaxID=3365899 RepID=UPI0038253BA5
MSPLALLPPPMPAAPPGPGPASVRPAPFPFVVSLPAAATTPAGADRAVRRAMARTARILDPGRRLSCTGRGLARQRRALGRHVRVLLPLAERGPHTDRARRVAVRAEVLLAQARSGQGLGALIAVVRAAERVRELAVLARPAPDALRVGCRAAVTGWVR